MPGTMHQQCVDWLAGQFDSVNCKDCGRPLKYCPHKPENKGYCRPDVVGQFQSKLAVGEVDCETKDWPCTYQIMDAETGEMMDAGNCPRPASK